MKITGDSPPLSTEAGKVIGETVDLLQSVSFATSQGEFLSGQYVNVFIDPRWEKETNSYQLITTCHVPANWDVPWQGLPIMLKPATGAGELVFIARLDHRGQAVIKSLAAGEYRLTLPAHWYFSEEPIIRPDYAVAIRHRGELEQGAVFESNDSRISVSSVQSTPDRLSLVFESQYSELDGAEVHFSVVRSTGQVELSGVVVLTRSEDGLLWRGHWEGTLTLTEACHLVFEVRPK